MRMLLRVLRGAAKWSLRLGVVGSLAFGATELRADDPDPLCHYSAGGCSDAGCHLHCGLLWTCDVVHGPSGDSCSCICIKET